MVSVCLPSDALLQHLPSCLGFSYLGHEVSPHGCSSKVQPLLLTLDEGYLLTAALPDLQCGIAPLGPPAPVQPLLLGTSGCDGRCTQCKRLRRPVHSVYIYTTVYSIYYSNSRVWYWHQDRHLDQWIRVKLINKS